MDKREPALVPEWLRSSGHGSGGGSSSNLLSSSSHSDSSFLSHDSKNRTLRSKSDVDSGRSPFLDRSHSTNTRRGASNGSTKHAYSSFNVNRSHRDREKDRSREKDRLSYMDPWDHDTSLPFGTFLTGRDKEQLRRSHSMSTRKQGDHLSHGVTVGLSITNNHNGEGTLLGNFPGKGLKKAGFDKDFPSLRPEERNGGPEIRVSSPVLSPAVQSLPVGNSALTVGEGWTSALAEVPNVIEKTGTASHAANVGNPAASTGPTCRNMAEALVQAPARTGTPPQGSVKTQSLEDRALKQSRQLIPVVPSAPKGSVLNSSDKSKTKALVRSGEAGLASRNNHQQPIKLLGNLQSNPGSQIKPDTNKKLVILKPARENGVAAVPAAGHQLTAAPSTQVTPLVKATNGPREPKAASVNMVAGKITEKKPSLAHTQSRSAFFSTLKQKPSTNPPTNPSKTNSCNFSPTEENSNSSKEPVSSDPSSDAVVERDVIVEKVEKVSGAAERNNVFESADRPDEKEAEFLKSLGWEENNSEEDEAITEEEIRAFIEECKKFKPSLIPKLIIQEATEGVTPKS